VPSREVANYVTSGPAAHITGVGRLNITLPGRFPYH